MPVTRVGSGWGGGDTKTLSTPRGSWFVRTDIIGSVQPGENEELHQDGGKHLWPVRWWMDHSAQPSDG